MCCRQGQKEAPRAEWQVLGVERAQPMRQPKRTLRKSLVSHSSSSAFLGVCFAFLEGSLVPVPRVAAATCQPGPVVPGSSFREALLGSAAQGRLGRSWVSTAL